MFVEHVNYVWLKLTHFNKKNKNKQKVLFKKIAPTNDWTWDETVTCPHLQFISMYFYRFREADNQSVAILEDVLRLDDELFTSQSMFENKSIS